MFRFCNPESFHPAEFLRTPSLMRLSDDARYFLSLILTKISRGQVDDDGNVRLMATHLRSIMHKHCYSKVINALLEFGAVERSPYAIGERAFGYRLSQRFSNDRHVRIEATDDRLIGRLTAFHQQAEKDLQSRLLPVHRALERHQQCLEIDGDLAREIIDGLPAESNPYDCQGILVRDIEDRDFHISLGNFGRLANNVTSLKREIRPSLRLGMEPLEHVDIRCCQPALIGQLVRAKQDKDRGQQGRQGASNYDAPDLQYLYTSSGKNSPGSGADMDLYCELVQSGELYDFLLTELRRQKCLSFGRDAMKKRVLCDVIAKKKANAQGDEYPSDVEDTFQGLFPSVYRFIREFNVDGSQHSNLIRELQRQESLLVIETVAADLVDNHPGIFLLTLHDAIYTTPRYIPDVIGAFERAFLRTGFAMALKVAR